jgi:fibronectin-binding autotransporter adhesin
MIRIFRLSSFVPLMTLLFAALPSTRADKWDDSARRASMRSEDFGVLESAFAQRGSSSDSSWFSVGPAWLINALPGSYRTQPRDFFYTVDLADSNLASNDYVGTLRDVFNVSLFSNVSFFSTSSGSKTSTPTIAAATPPDYYWDVNGSASGLGGTGTWDAGTTANWNDSTGTGTAIVWVNGNNAIFSGIAGTITLNSAVTARSLLFSVNGYGITGSGTLTLTNTGSGGPGPATIEVQNGVVSIGTQISGTDGMSKTGSGILVLSGTNTYTGDTSIRAGELILTPSGSLVPSSTIRLGDTIANSPSAMFSFGAIGGGTTLANPMTVQPSASGTEGTRTLLGLAESGNTNTYSGTITMNAGLTVQSAAVGNTVANGQGILLFQGGSIDVGTSTLTVNTNLNNNADTYSIQGIVTINEVLGSSQATGGSLVKDGSGTLILQGTSNTYTGTNAAALNANGTQIGGGILGIFADGSLGFAPTNEANNVFFIAPGTNVNGNSIGPTLRADANNISLAATRDINIASGVTARFDSNGNTFTINGSMNGSGNIVKVGSGMLTLTGPNFVTGTATISTNGGTLNAAANSALGSGSAGTAIGPSAITVNSGGTLMLSNSSATDRVRSDAPITLAGGTIGRSGPGVVSEGTGASRNGATVTGTSTVGLGALTLTSNATIDFNLLSAGGVGTLTFASFTANGNTLNILNWTSNANFSTPTSGVDGTDDRLIFGGALPPTTAFITFNGAASTFIALDPFFYEVVPLTPIPEPSTWVGAAVALVAIAFSQRRRLLRRG